MKIIIRIIVTAILVLLIAHFMTGVKVASFGTSLLVAFVLGMLNIFIKPLLVIFTLPVTLITFGLFLLVINAVMILLCTQIVGGFSVDTFGTAVVFSMILSILQSITFTITGGDK